MEQCWNSRIHGACGFGKYDIGLSACYLDIPNLTEDNIMLGNKSFAYTVDLKAKSKLFSFDLMSRRSWS